MITSLAMIGVLQAIHARGRLGAGRGGEPAPPSPRSSRRLPGLAREVAGLAGQGASAARLRRAVERRRAAPPLTEGGDPELVRQVGILDLEREQPGESTALVVRRSGTGPPGR